MSSADEKYPNAMSSLLKASSRGPPSEVDIAGAYGSRTTSAISDESRSGGGDACEETLEKAGTSGGDEGSIGDRKMSPSELKAHLRVVSESQTGAKTMGSPDHDAATKQEDDAIFFVREFLAALKSTKTGLSVKQKRNMVGKREEKRERKRKINRLSAHRKRIRERDLIDTLSGQLKELASANEALKAEGDQLRTLLLSARNLPSNGGAVAASQEPPSALAPAQKISAPQQQQGATVSSAPNNHPQHQVQALFHFQTLASQQLPPHPSASVNPIQQQLYALLALITQTQNDSVLQALPPPPAQLSSLQEQLQALNQQMDTAAPQQAVLSIYIQDLLQSVVNAGDPVPAQPEASLPSLQQLLQLQGFSLQNMQDTRPFLPQLPAALDAPSLQHQRIALLELEQASRQLKASSFSTVNAIQDQLQSLLARAHQGVHAAGTPQQAHYLSTQNTGTTNPAAHQHLLAMLLQSATARQQQQVAPFIQQQPSHQLALVQSPLLTEQQALPQANLQSEQLKSLLTALSGKLLLEAGIQNKDGDASSAGNRSHHNNGK